MLLISQQQDEPRRACSATLQQQEVGQVASQCLSGVVWAQFKPVDVWLHAGVYNTIGVDAGAPSFTLSSTSLDITAFAVSLLLVFRCVQDCMFTKAAALQHAYCAIFGHQTVTVFQQHGIV
jgi:hypothetical protein